MLVHMLLPTFMVLHLYFAAPTQRFAIFFLTFNMLVNKHSDFLELDFLKGVYLRGTLGLLYVISSRVDTIEASKIYFMFFICFLVRNIDTWKVEKTTQYIFPVCK